jgi:hypothetical protein
VEFEITLYAQVGVSLFWAWRRGHLRRQVTPPRMVIITRVSTLKKGQPIVGGLWRPFGLSFSVGAYNRKKVLLLELSVFIQYILCM